MRQDNAQARERFTSSPATRLDPRLPLVKDAEDTVEVRRFDQAVPAVRVQCAAPPARVAVRDLIRLMMAHLNPKALQLDWLHGCGQFREGRERREGRI